MSRDNEYQIIRRPLLTEKNMHRADTRNTYTFEVSPDANKVEVRQAIERLFKVKVKAVKTVRYKGKPKRRGYDFYTQGAMKKAIVTLQEGHKIDLI
ncbi:MAG TPA: 50S ribosomal protein L23 [Planctomycetes bacterium]|nr:50S ribosomal protein L23 [Planctomycetota bacterium]